MIPLSLPATIETEQPFITRLRVTTGDTPRVSDSVLVTTDEAGASFAGVHGLVSIDGLASAELDGDVVLVQPDIGRIERLLRRGSPHNTLLLTERCDQLCVMCSQPPKKTHVDRFALLEQACLLAEPNSVIGLTGGEPTLYKDQLLGMIERVLAARDDLEFHVLSNAQHFTQEDVERLRQPQFRRVTWGIPLYARDSVLHDEIVGKPGAFAQLMESFAILLLAGARIELRTVLIATNLAALPALAKYVTSRLRFVETWSIMQLENIGFAKGRWGQLFVDHMLDFRPIATALDHAGLHGVPVHLFNFPRCTVPFDYRDLAPASISDWKRKYPAACDACSEKDQCCGFFEWHPDAQARDKAKPI